MLFLLNFSSLLYKYYGKKSSLFYIFISIKEYLDEGEPFGLDLPKAQDDGVLWSGLRRAQSAVVRVFKQGGGKAEIAVEPWPGKKVLLQATDKGRTYLLKLDNDLVRVEKK